MAGEDEGESFQKSSSERARGTEHYEELVMYAHLRWTVEQFHKEAKQLLGSDSFEGRSWKGWHDHVTVVMLAHAFLSMLRAEQDTHDPPEPANGGESNRARISQTGSHERSCFQTKEGSGSRYPYAQEVQRVVNCGSNARTMSLVKLQRRQQLGAAEVQHLFIYPDVFSSY